MISRRIAVVVSFLLLGLGLVAPQAVGVATFTPTRFDDPPPGTCDPADCSLREAIRAANSLAGPDTIVLAAGTYSLSIPSTFEDAAADGDLDVTDSVTIIGQGTSATTVDGNGVITDDRVFEIDPIGPGTGPTVELEGLTIRGGRTTDTFERGGGLYIHYLAKVTLRDVVITGNSVLDFADGGAIYTRDDASLTIIRTLISGNFADGDGGAIAIWNDATMSITDSVLSSNHATSNGGAIHSRNQVVSAITRTTVSGNTSDGEGGGIHQYNETVLTLVGSTVSGNSAVEQGGGLYLRNAAQGTVSSSTISGNLAEGSGGGIATEDTSTLHLANVTVANNAADSDNATGGDGGGVAQLEMSTVDSAGSILAGNSDPSSAPDCFGTFSSGGYNVVGSTAGCGFAPQVTDATGVDAKLDPLADNGGPTMTHALRKGSPALDRRPKGDPGCSGTDQRGVPRPQTGGCDSGAYELALCQKVTVNRVGTSGNDVLTGTGAKDGILALGGKDKLKGKGGADGLCGGPGKDTLRAGAGKDKLDGGPGKDTCVGQGGKDKAKACEKEKGIP